MLLEWIGVVSPSYVVRDGALLVMPGATASAAMFVVPCLFLVNVLIMALALKQARRTRDAMEDAQTRLNIQTWHLGLMVPAEARHAVREANVKDGQVFLEPSP